MLMISRLKFFIKWTQKPVVVKCVGMFFALGYNKLRNAPQKKEMNMKKSRLLIIILLITLLLSACKPKSPAETPGKPDLTKVSTKAPDSPAKQPTHTPRHLGPIYQTKIFLGGEGWAWNVDKTQYYRTTNFGEHWVTVTPPDFSKEMRDYPLITSFFYSGRTGYIMLSRPEEKSMLFISRDGGESWETNKLDMPGGALYFISATEGFMLASLGVGAGSEYVAVHHTTDSGKTWDTVFSHEPGQEPGTLPSSGIKNGITFMDENIGFITGSAPITESLYLYRTADGGQSWEQKSCENLPVFGEGDMWVPSPVRRIDPSTAFIAIEAFIAERDTTVTHWCKTTDAGESWQFVSSRDQITASDFGTADFGVALGNGKLLRTLDGGVTWEDFSHNACPSMVPVTIRVVSQHLAHMICSSNGPGHLEALNQMRLFASMSQGRLWQTLEANIIK